jgi:hypothetical protein
MVHSSTLAVATDGERLTSGNFSLSETVPFGSLDFITDCFGDLSLSTKGGGGRLKCYLCGNDPQRG